MVVRHVAALIERGKRDAGTWPSGRSFRKSVAATLSPPSDRLVDSPLESTQTGDAMKTANADANLVAPESTASAKATPNKRPNL
jgi:hypothetical protein